MIMNKGITYFKVFSYPRGPCGILVPQPEYQTRSLQWTCGSLNPWTAGAILPTLMGLA